MPEKGIEGVRRPPGTGPMGQPNKPDMQDYQMQLMLLEQKNKKGIRDGVLCAICGGKHFKTKL